MRRRIISACPPGVTIRLAGGGEPRSFGRKNLNVRWRRGGIVDARLAGLRGGDEAQATRASLVSQGWRAGGTGPCRSLRCWPAWPRRVSPSGRRRARWPPRAGACGSPLRARRSGSPGQVDGEGTPHWAGAPTTRCPRLVSGDAIDSLDGDLITVDQVHDSIPANP
jgi:hypothetical protein